MIDYSRHADVFKPHEFDKRVDVVGVGAIGSRITLSLAKLGVRDSTVWDDDIVEAHNVANQAYGVIDALVKPDKVVALQSKCENEAGVVINTNPVRVTKDNALNLSEVVFVAVDSMTARKEIYNALPHWCELLIDVRMGATEGRIYTIPLNSMTAKKGYESTLYADTPGKVGVCGTPLSIGPTAEIVSGMAVWQMLKWFRQEEGDYVGEDLENEVMFAVRPFLITTRNF